MSFANGINARICADSKRRERFHPAGHSPAAIFQLNANRRIIETRGPCRGKPTPVRRAWSRSGQLAADARHRHIMAGLRESGNAN